MVFTAYTEVNKGCCGTGVSEIGTQCNSTTSLCSDANKYVFWDAGMQPTQLRRQMKSFSKAILQPLMTSLGASF
ncbi:hypothetical protein RHMOL_Rhmol06G0253500 [Rhododendron molle]|uniref:Uncharacterized protein n=1 Tax=Rhododendron molle TaxID=49168 RepID=A0ACC0NGE6_RHOML|nr:hypothetical protein RHMOL_Rhmol06G0253500 [Rhododendron molle]